MHITQQKVQRTDSSYGGWNPAVSKPDYVFETWDRSPFFLQPGWLVIIGTKTGKLISFNCRGFESPIKQAVCLFHPTLDKSLCPRKEETINLPSQVWSGSIFNYLGPLFPSAYWGAVRPLWSLSIILVFQILHLMLLFIICHFYDYWQFNTFTWWILVISPYITSVIPSSKGNLSD